jgi:hypothetical protein
MRISDKTGEFSIIEALGFLNSALHSAYALLAAGKSPLMIQERVFKDGDTLPDGFLRTVGKYPLKVTGTTINLFDATKPLKVRFYAELELLKDDSGDMPFTNDAINEWVVKLAAIYAQNQNEYDVSQDKQLMAEFQQALVASASG